MKLAEMINVSRQAITKWERDGNNFVAEYYDKHVDRAYCSVYFSIANRKGNFIQI